MPVSDILNFIAVDDDTLTGGQPTEAQLRDAAAEGVQVVVNLALGQGPGALPDEAGLVRGFGLDYVHIPVAWERPTPADFEAFARAMDQAAGKRVLIHCAANYRATAFYSLYAQRALGWTPARAAALRGRVWKPGEYPWWDEFIRRLEA